MYTWSERFKIGFVWAVTYCVGLEVWRYAP